MTRITLTSDEAAPLPQITSAEADLVADTAPAPIAATSGGATAGSLRGKVALVSGGDRGFGHAAALALAGAGADVAILYLDGHEAAQDTMRAIVEIGSETMALTGDIGLSSFCDDAVAQVLKRFGRIDILVNAIAVRHAQPEFEQLDDAQIERMFRVNIIGQMFLTRATLPHLRAGASIVNTSAQIALTGDPLHVDAAATHGAIIAFTRSLAAALAPRGIRANSIAPTDECPPAAAAATYLYLASDAARLMTGQTLHPDGAIVLGDIGD